MHMHIRIINYLTSFIISAPIMIILHNLIERNARNTLNILFNLAKRINLPALKDLTALNTLKNEKNMLLTREIIII